MATIGTFIRAAPRHSPARSERFLRLNVKAPRKRSHGPGRRTTRLPDYPSRRWIELGAKRGWKDLMPAGPRTTLTFTSRSSLRTIRASRHRSSSLAFRRDRRPGTAMPHPGPAATSDPVAPRCLRPLPPRPSGRGAQPPFMLSRPAALCRQLLNVEPVAAARVTAAPTAHKGKRKSPRLSNDSRAAAPQKHTSDVDFSVLRPSPAPGGA